MRRPTRAPSARRARPVRFVVATLVPLAALVLVALLAGCAKKGPPSGGPPDLEPPHIVSTEPDSGAAGVSRLPQLSVTFSEGMEPRTTGEAIELAPPVPIRQRRWAGRTLTLVLKDSLRAEHTYTLYTGSNARDRHGNNLLVARTVVFTTAPSFPPGRLQGRVDPVGFKAAGTTLWCYRDGHLPDSTARDFDALGVADAAGDFDVGGLSVPGTWRVWGFADLNRNRSFEPASDLLVAADTVLTLSAEHPVATGIRLHMVNPRAPARFAGSVLDSVSDQSGAARLIVTSLADTTRRVVYEVPASGVFDFQWEPGRYRVRAYRDLDGNRAWKRDSEPASAEITTTLEPGADVTGVVFVLVRPEPGAGGP